MIAKILFMCRKEKYSLIEDFAWYTSILLDLAVMQGTRHGEDVANQLIEVALRVPSIRPYAVEMMISILLNEQLVLGHARETVSEVLRAAAWIVSEYCDVVANICRDRSDSLDSTESTNDGEHHRSAYWIEGVNGEEIRSNWRGQRVHFMVIDVLLHPKSTNLSVRVQTVYLHSAMKIFISATKHCEYAELADIVGVVRSRLPVFMQVNCPLLLRLSDCSLRSACT